MALLAICPERALTPLEEIRDAIIVVDGRRIVAVGRRGELRLPPGAQKYSAPGITVVPGFVDVHIHGAGGHDVMESTPEALEAVAASVARRDRKSTRLNSSHGYISYAVFCLKKKNRYFRQ